MVKAAQPQQWHSLSDFLNEEENRKKNEALPSATSSVSIKAGNPDSDSPDPDSPQAGSLRGVDGVHPERRSASDSPVPDSPSVNLWSSLPQVEGHLRLPNIIIDHLYKLLDLQERSVYEQLYRLSHGYGKSTCRISYPQLAARAGLGRSTSIQVVDRLEKKGLIFRQERKIGGRTEQGTIYLVSAPGSPVFSSPVPDSPRPTRNKEKDLKETYKKMDTASHQKKDYSACPDCAGTSMWYPEGYGHGVAKCKHEKLK